LDLRTPVCDPLRVSGAVRVTTGAAKAGSNSFNVVTSSLGGHGGSISLSVGNTGAGGLVRLTAGESSAIVEIRGGLGSSADPQDGGNGGYVELLGGEALEGRSDVGGDVGLSLRRPGLGLGRLGRQPAALKGRLGAGQLGPRRDPSADSGPGGVSGSVAIDTGASSSGDSGALRLITGKASQGHNLALLVGQPGRHGRRRLRERRRGRDLCGARRGRRGQHCRRRGPL
jgi:hypothetical protein